MQPKSGLVLLCDWYSPATKAGGPVVSVQNLVNALKDKISIDILTADRDLHDKVGFKNIIPNVAITLFENTTITYLTPQQTSFRFYKHFFKKHAHNTIHLNSMFSPKFSIIPLLCLWRYHCSNRIVLSPRGMLSEEALSIKPLKKKIYLALFKRLKLHRKVIFHSTSAAESERIQSFFGANCRYFELPNFSTPLLEKLDKIEKIPGKLNVLFIGRIYPIKNLHIVIQSIVKNKQAIQLTICGPIEDPNYWHQCKLLLESNSIAYKYLGEVPQKDLYSILAQNHLTFTPSKSENFGHAIIESLKAKTPVLTTENVPWLQLKKHNAGFNFKETATEAFENALATFINMDQEQYQIWSNGALLYANISLNEQNLVNDYLKMYSLI